MNVYIGVYEKCLAKFQSGYLLEVKFGLFLIPYIFILTNFLKYVFL